VTRTYGRETIPLERLRQILERQRGLNQAITARNLAALLGLSERDGRSIREGVNDLLKLGYPIGSSTGEGSQGYFWVVTDYELSMCLANYRSRARENIRKAEWLERAFRQGPRQPELLHGLSHDD